MTGKRTGGEILADQIAAFGGETLFTVPGESFLGLLDGLHRHRETIRVVTCRHEGGAANMAEAWGKLTGTPGLCAVTRGPGATHASNGVHTAFQDSTPMILLIGQVARHQRDREAFQEVDYRAMFAPLAKWVAEIDDPARVPEYFARAWAVAQEGRPGPVVLALPEDMLAEQADVADARRAPLARPAPDIDAMAHLGEALANAMRPLLVLGGPGWSADCARLAAEAASRHGLPVATAFRCQDYIDNAHPHYTGVLGIGPVPQLARAVREEADLLVVVGARMGEITTGGYDLLDIPTPRMRLAQVHPAPDEIGRVYRADIPVASTARNFLDALAVLPATAPDRGDWTSRLRAAYEAWSAPTEVPGEVNLGRVVAHLGAVLPEDTIVTNGAGNYAIWVHRFHSYRTFRSQLAPTSGSMGYGVPAAIAAKLRHPDREVVSIAGDGCFLMTAQELATAARERLAITFIVVNNGMYGTIRMHQERHHPGHVMATDLTNPDFVAYAGAFGIPGERVGRTEDFPAALARARASGNGYLIELRTDPEAITPATTLSGLARS